MNFTRLLAAGKSLIGMRDEHTPYRMRQKNFLPKFDSPKNPFSKAEKPDAVGASPSAPVSPTAQPVQPAIMETSPLFAEQAKPAAQPIPLKEAAPKAAEPIAVPVPPQPALVSLAPATDDILCTYHAPRAKSSPAKTVRKPELKTSWMDKVNPLNYLPGQNSNFTHKNNKSAQAQVQAELSLENVRVIRNDLSDSDLEVISSGKSAKNDAMIRSAQTISGSQPTTVGRLTSRIFGHEPTQVQ